MLVPLAARRTASFIRASPPLQRPSQRASAPAPPARALPPISALAAIRDLDRRSAGPVRAATVAAAAAASTAPSYASSSSAAAAHREVLASAMQLSAAQPLQAPVYNAPLFFGAAPSVAAPAAFLPQSHAAEERSSFDRARAMLTEEREQMAAAHQRRMAELEGACSPPPTHAPLRPPPPFNAPPSPPPQACARCSRSAQMR